MRVVQINNGNIGSIGNIMKDISCVLTDNNIETYLMLAAPTQPVADNTIQFSSANQNRISRMLGRVTGFSGCFAYTQTYRLLRKLEQLHPDVVHLHNLHDGYVNLNMLFEYLKRHHISVVWTLHDCWAFTGKCPYFEITACDKWIEGCYSCPSLGEYPKAFFDRTAYLYNKKRELFTSLDNLTLVTPSEWLRNCVRKSYLSGIPVYTIYNGVDHKVFHYRENDFRERYGIANKEIILGCASPFNHRKGIDIFVRMAQDLDENKYVIVLIGLDDEQISVLPDKMIKIHRTNNREELAMWYSEADVFVNPTREEVLGMTNIEAMSCGTPVVTFRTGGSTETVDKDSGIVIDKDDYNSLLECLNRKEYKRFNPDACIRRASEFSKEKMGEEYLRLYRLVSGKKCSKMGEVQD